MKTMYTSHQTKIDLVIPEKKLHHYTYPQNSRKKKKKNKCMRRKKNLIVLLALGILAITAAAGIIIYVLIMNSNNSGDGRNPNPDSNSKPLRPNPDSNPKSLRPEDLEFIKKFPGLLSPNGANSCFVIDAVNILWNTNLREEVPHWKIGENKTPLERESSATFAFKELFTTNDADIRFHFIQQLRKTVRGFHNGFPYPSGHQDAIAFLKHLLETMKKEKGLQQDILDYGLHVFDKETIYDTDLVDQLSGEKHPQLFIFDTKPNRVLRKFETSEKFSVGESTYELASISGGTPGHYVPFLRDYQGDGWWISLSFEKREVYKTLADVQKTSDGGHGENDRGAHAYIYVKTN